jgi:hypothetical protein
MDDPVGAARFEKHPGQRLKPCPNPDSEQILHSTTDFTTGAVHDADLGFHL